MDSKQRTYLHHSIQPFKLYSYKNIEMLRVFKSEANNRQRDSRGETPLDYIKKFRNSVYGEELGWKAGVGEGREEFNCTKLIEAKTSQVEKDYERNFKQFMDEMEKRNIKIKHEFHLQPAY